MVGFGTAILLGCVSTTAVEAPALVFSDIPFEVAVTAEATDTLSGNLSTDGYLFILVPSAWSVDSVFIDGFGYIGPADLMYWSGLLDYYYPPDSGYAWLAAQTSYDWSSYIGEVGNSIVVIRPGNEPGTFTMAFLAAIYDGMSDLHWDGDPCSCIVEVTPLLLEQETWGHIKSELGQ